MDENTEQGEAAEPICRQSVSYKKDGEEEKSNKKEESNRVQVAWAVNIHLFCP